MGIVISDSVILSAPDSDVTALRRAHIGYKTVVARDIVTASTEAAGFPASNIANPLTAHRWKPTELPATLTATLASIEDISYIGIASHTLATNQCKIEFQTSDDEGATWATVAETAPGNNRAIMAILSFSTKYLRIRISRVDGAVETGIPSIGVMMAGDVLIMQRGIYQGHTPITLGRNTRRITNKTEGGQYAGSSIITEGVSTSFEWGNIEPDWMRQTFDPFVLSARTSPFFIAWRPEDYPEEVGYCWTDGDIRPQNSGPRGLMSVSMSVNGYSDE